MKRVIGSLAAAMMSAALWGCNAVKNIFQEQGAVVSTSAATSAPGGVDPSSGTTATSAPGGVDPSASPTGTVVIVPDGQDLRPTPIPSPTSNPSSTPTAEPTSTPTPRPLWAPYNNFTWKYLTPKGIEKLQAWSEHGVKLYYSSWNAENLVTGMAKDEETGDIVFELARLDPDEYGFTGGNFYPLKKNIGIDGRPAWGYPDWGFGGTFVERDGNLSFHKPGPAREVGPYVMNTVAGYIGLPRHINGGIKAWDFSKMKSERRLIPPRGVFDGIEIEVAPEVPIKMVSDIVKATYPLDITQNSGSDGGDEFNQRLAYDEKKGVLLIGGWADGERYTPTFWWGAVRETSQGKKLYVGTKQRLWYLHRNSLAETRIVSWIIKQDTVYAIRAAGRYSCDTVRYGRVERDNGVDCWLDTFRFPLDLIIDSPPEPKEKP